MRLAATPPTWALVGEAEGGWSRRAPSALHTWAEPDQLWRRVEQGVAKDAPDPKALAGYGRLVRWMAPAGRRTEAAGRRCVAGRPGSARTTAVLAWGCAKWAAAGKEARRRVWANAPWPVSHAGRQGMRAPRRPGQATGRGVRIVNCDRRIKRPWLNPSEPQWAQGKRRVVEPARLLSATELRGRGCAAFDGPDEDLLCLPVPLGAHRVLPEQVA